MSISLEGMDEVWMGGIAIQRQATLLLSSTTAGEAGEGVAADNAGETLDGYVDGGHRS
jgi:hypothetical protein